MSATEVGTGWAVLIAVVVVVVVAVAVAGTEVTAAAESFLRQRF